MIYELFAQNISKEIDIKALSQKSPYYIIGAKRQFLILSAKKHKDEKNLLFVFKFGIIVFVNLDNEKIKEVSHNLSPFLLSKIKEPNSDSYVLKEEEKEEITMSEAKISKITIKEIELAARILAQSVEIDYFDTLVEEALSKLANSQQNLEKNRIFGGNGKFIKIITFANSINTAVVNELFLLDKPTIVWEDPKLKKYFSHLVETFELNDRFKNLQYKVKLLITSSQFIVDLMQSRKSNTLEWIIIILIAFEIIIFLAQVFHFI